MNLTGQNVAVAFKASLFEPGQPTDTAVIAEGVVMKAGFDPVRLEAQRAAVEAMIAELQDPFSRTQEAAGVSWPCACGETGSSGGSTRTATPSSASPWRLT